MEYKRAQSTVEEEVPLIRATWECPDCRNKDVVGSIAYGYVTKNGIIQLDDAEEENPKRRTNTHRQETFLCFRKRTYSMNKKDGSQLLVKCLENEGVEYVFGIPGEQTIDVMEELRKSDIEFIVTRHEQGAAFMADIYGRLSNSVGVCLSTLGPGATNLVTGLGNATLDQSPVVALTSQRGLNDQHKHSHQFINTNSVFDEITHRTDMIRETETIPEQVRKSFEIAKREPQGATHLELPANMRGKTSFKPLDSSKNAISPSGVEKTNVVRALEMLSKSKKPLILAGNGILSQDASDVFTEFVSCSGIPVVTTFMGKGSISHENPNHVGVIGFDSNDYTMNSVKQADLIMTVGYNYIEYHPECWNIGEEKRMIHVDNTEPEIDSSYGTELTLIGNINRILEQFNNHTNENLVEKSYSQELRESYIERRNKEYDENSSAPFTPQQIISSLRSAAGPQDVVISDVGSHKYWLSRRYPTYEPNTFIVSNGFASMGIALPGAVGAELATQNNTIAVAGDGGLLMNIQELETVKRVDASPTIIVLNDREYTAITMEQQAKFKKDYGASFENPDFVSLAESFGINGKRILNANNLESEINNSIESDSTSLISIPVSTQESYSLEES